MKKLASILTAIVLCLTMLPGMLFVSAEETWDFVTVREYAEESAPHITDTSKISYSKIEDLPDREFTRDYVPTEKEWAFKLSAPAGVSRNIWFIKWINEEYAPQAAGLRIWVANPSDSTASFRWNYNASYSGVDKTYPIPANKPYYLQSADGNTVHQYSTSAYNSTHGYINLPAGFMGWLYLPFGTRAYEYNRIRMFIDGGAETATTVYVSRMEYYNSGVISAATVMDYTFDTMQTLDTSKMGINSSSTASVTTEYRDGNYGQALKVVNALTNLRFNSMCKNLANATASGIKFWIKNPQSSSIKIMLMANDSNVSKNATYYLQPENGVPYITKTVQAHESARAAIVIPANFTGYVYLPYTAQPTNLKSGHLILNFGDSSATGCTVYLDSFGNYNFSDFDKYNFMTFDEITAPDTYMWDYSGISEVSTEVADGSGKSIKVTLRTDATTPNRFRNFMPSYTDATIYNNSLGYKVWVKNPNSFAISAFPQFTTESRPAVVGNTYYLVTENELTGHKFKALNPSDKALGCVTLPAGFEGYIYIPKTSINFGSKVSFDFTKSSTIQFRLNFLAVSETGVVYLDSIGLYNAVDELVHADLNGDKVVDIRDLVRMKKYAVGSVTFINDLCLDVDGNGTVELAIDLSQLRKILLGNV